MTKDRKQIFRFAYLRLVAVAIFEKGGRTRPNAMTQFRAYGFVENSISLRRSILGTPGVKTSSRVTLVRNKHVIPAGDYR